MDMKAEEFRNLTADELDTKVLQFRKDMFNFRVQAKVGKLENPSKLRALRRDLARALTIRREWSRQEPKAGESKKEESKKKETKKT